MRGEVANNDGTWDGRRHQFDSRLQQRMRTEYKRRFRNKLDQMGQLALDAIEDLLTDSDNPAQRAAMAKMITEYQVGKPEERVVVGVDTEWDRLQAVGFVIMRGEENVAVGGSGAHEIVPGEVVKTEE